MSAPTSTLVLLRHGESEWNALNLFTGWYDADLTEKGSDEAAHAGRLMDTAAIGVDVLHTSLQVRAIRTANLALDQMGLLWLPVRRSWRLNERHYGALQGKDKKQTSAEFGADQVKIWRRSYDTPPPPVAMSDPHHPRNDPRYAGLPLDVLPASECLADVLDRMLPYFYDGIMPDLQAGKRVLVAAHGNSLRALVKHLKGISDTDISELNIPTGQPWVFEIDAEGRYVSDSYLDPQGAADAAEAVSRQAETDPDEG